MEAKPDALVIIGDDQGENFNTTNMPPFAVYVGSKTEGSFSLGRRLPMDKQEDLRRVEVACDDNLAKNILDELFNGDLEVAFSEKLSGDGLGHAHIWPLKFLTPELHIPIVPIFINAYFAPQPKPNRCYLLGELLAKAIHKSHKRVAIFGSGGLSHFPRHLGSWGIPPYPLEKRWSIDESFDRKVLDLLLSGEGHELSELSSEDLRESGNLELRNWIALSGVLGDRKGKLLAYEPVYTVAIGLAFAAWV
jgi:aromatic ring-opening dioxygenase LigB subunit